jgi:type IV pilus assembly protein PilW
MRDHLHVPFRTQRGLSLIELMISMALALIVVLLATTFFLSSRNVYTTQDESSKINDTGRLVSQVLTRIIQQTGFIPRYNADITTVSYDHTRAPASQFALLFGVNNGVTRWTGTNSGTINNSDSLTIRFWGSGGSPGNADGTVADCLGQEIPAPGTGANAADIDRAQMTFYLSLDASNEPGLVCSIRVFSTNGETVQPIARGVERLQFLYGVDTSAPPRDNMPDVYVNAAQVTANGWWDRVVAVRYAFMVRSGLNARTEPDNTLYQLFGPAYTQADAGVTLDAANLSSQERTRLRRVFSGVVHLRNGVEGNNQ